MQISGNTTIKELLDAGIICTRSYNCCNNNGLQTVQDVYQFHVDHSFREMKSAGRKVNMELTNVCAIYLSNNCDRITPTLEWTSTGFESRPNLDAFLTSSFLRLKSGLSVRARHLCEDTFHSYYDVIDYFKYQEEPFLKIFGTKRKTAKELFLFVRRYHSLYQEYIAYDEKVIEFRILEEEYVFLLSPEIKYVTEKRKEIGHLPMLFIIERYLSISSDRQSVLFAQYYGISSGKHFSQEELADMNATSRERVRQLINGYTLPDFLSVNNNDNWETYKASLPLFISKKSNFYINNCKEENLKNDFTSFCGLIVAAFDYTIIKSHKDSYLVSSKYVNEGRVALKEVKKVFDNKYPVDTRFSIKEEFKTKDQDIANIYKIIISELYDTEVSNSGSFIIKQGRVSIEDELIAVLNIFGEPMALDDLFLLFKDKYPNHKYEKPDSIRYIIIRSERIVAIGKSGLYGLSEWNLFRGSIRDYAYSVLSKAPCPLSDEELTEQVLHVFTQSNPRSIISALMSDPKERFIRFQNQSVGLVERKYSSQYKPILPLQQFDERLQSLRDFIIKHQRLPFLNGGEEEMSLHRWIGNHTRPQDKHYSVEEANKIKELLYEYREFPSNGKEYKFYLNCVDYKRYVTNMYALPSIDSSDEDEERLARWFATSLNNHKTSGGNFKSYFEDLIDFLNGYGFVFE